MIGLVFLTVLWVVVALVSGAIYLDQLRASRRYDDEVFLIAVAKRKAAVRSAKARAKIRRAFALRYGLTPDDWRDAA
jgi:hypothetical protein